MERMLQHASSPPADPAFRSRLRERFLDPEAPSLLESDADHADRRGARTAAAGNSPSTEQGRATERGITAGRDVEQDRDVAPSGATVPPRGRIFPFVWPAVLAASVALIMWFVLAGETRARWRILDLESGSPFIVDGRTVDPSDAARLADLLQSAHEIETGEQALRLQLADELVIELAPRTHVSQLTFPASGSWSMRTDSGSVRLATGPGFPGRRLRVLTNEMEVTVTGTSFGIDVLSSGTCLCCLHGVVMCDARDGAASQSVRAGGLGFAYEDGSPAKWGNAFEAHLVPLRDLEAAVERHGWRR
jgi:hypothetical protein